ncbi:nucleoside monophosphate kinase [Candidatus Saccharibacteria bacterium]|nr:nucleoside monophosphate kinase [Candidatus Saccharibacteria bacterium]
MILLMGIAGSGKGTQGKMLADQNGYHLFSMGEVLRMYVTGAQRERMLAGGLLDDQEIIKIVDKVLMTIPPEDEVILDGFPRTIPQAEWLLNEISKNRWQLTCVFHLVASHEAVRARLMTRGRIDDKEKVIEARFSEYERSTAPLLTWFGEHDVTVLDVNAERSMYDVNDDLIEYLKSNS